MQIIIGFFFVLLLTTTTLANTCRAVQWPFSKEVKTIQPLSLQSISRAHVYSYLYFEIGSPAAKRIPGLAEKLFGYLKNTEINEAKFQLIQALEYAADLNTSHPRIIHINEICALLDKAQNSTKETR